MFAPNHEKIEHYAHDMRVEVLRMINAAGSGHTAGSLGMADVFATLFFSGIYKYDPSKPQWEDRDILILSNAHIAPIYYASLAFSGYFPRAELLTLRKFGSQLQGHPNNHFARLGIETSGGPLGQGMSVAVGYALSKKINKKDTHVFCFCSDGELNEGQAWESVMSAAKFKLDNLIYIVDRNHIQIDGTSDEIMPLEPLHEKFASFGCDVVDVSGNDISKIYNALKYAVDQKGAKPTALIMHTIPGKGVSFMENDYKWHGKAPNGDELERALNELK